MKSSRLLRVMAATGLLLAIAAVSPAGGQLPERASRAVPNEGSSSSRPRIIVLTDAGTEVDDQQSLVRLLVYANDLEIEALVATTSGSMRETVHPGLIEERVRAYGEALPNLRVHATGYPDAAHLMQRIHTSNPTYGMSGVGPGKDSPASRAIIEIVDRPDDRPVWVTIWGGAKDLAQALSTVRASRTSAETDRFIAKLRVYSISDQDDAGPWLRRAFPNLFWIASIHADRSYSQATWNGIASALRGADPIPVSKPWLQANIQAKGPLGALYPTTTYGMEGDTPSFLYLIPNGLGSPEHPEWGSWGGRYAQLAGGGGLRTDSTDRIRIADGTEVADNRGSVWRWRGAFQNDFAAHMSWAVTSRFRDANHPPLVRLNGVAGDAPVVISTCPDEPVHLSAGGSTDPDGQPLTFRWWQYREATGIYSPMATIRQANGLDAIVTVPAPLASPQAQALTTNQIHIVLEATDSGYPKLTRYRRAILALPLADNFDRSRTCR